MSLIVDAMIGQDSMVDTASEDLPDSKTSPVEPELAELDSPAADNNRDA